MTTLITIHALSKAHGSQQLFEEISFTICSGERIGLIGPNGAGKSTLLKIIKGLESADDGHITKRQNLRIAYAAQSPDFPDSPIEDLLAKELVGVDPIESMTKARTLLSKAEFQNNLASAATLSGGWKKRLDIVRAFMIDPDLVLLDEPTNHLDLEGIVWLEKFLIQTRTALLIVSHDRYFLEMVAEKVIELNRCYPKGLFICDEGMTQFTTRKEAFLEVQAAQEQVLTAAVRDDTDWLRRSPKARTTKSFSRIQRAYALMEELKSVQTRNKIPKVNLGFRASDRETRKLLVGKNLTKSMGSKPLFKGIDLTLSPGTRLGLLGKNGTGKTTLLKILSGEISLDAGTLKYADDLNIVYFDQHREQIPLDATLRRALSPAGDTVYYQGQEIHVNGWAKRFLFSPDRMELPVKYLSGGERARILIARLMLKPADVLFLDEPTNDLDISTLEVMEESLKEFPGAIVLITHDRCLMDRVCNRILVLGEELEGSWFADFSQWKASLKQAAKLANVKQASQNNGKQKASNTTQKITPQLQAKKPLSFKEKKELEGMEDAIAKSEKEMDLLQRELEIAAPDKIQELYHALAEEQKKHDALFVRWQELLNKG